MTKEFTTAFVDDFLDDFEHEVEEAVRETFLDGHAEAVRRSRVKSGRYRGNVRYGQGRIPNDNDENPPFDTGIEIGKVDLKQQHSLFNNVPYADSDWSIREVLEPTAARMEVVLEARLEDRLGLNPIGGGS